MQLNRTCRLLLGFVLYIALCSFGLLLPDMAKADTSKPLLFLVAGQSNARGTADKPSSITVPAGAFWDGDNWVNTIKDPVFPAKRGSLCPALAKVISEKTNRKVYIINKLYQK